MNDFPEIKNKKKTERYKGLKSKLIHLLPGTKKFLSKLSESRGGDLKKYIETHVESKAKEETIYYLATELSPEGKQRWQELENLREEMKIQQYKLIYPLLKKYQFNDLLVELKKKEELHSY